MSPKERNFAKDSSCDVSPQSNQKLPFKKGGKDERTKMYSPVLYNSITAMLNNDRRFNKGI